VAEEIESWTKEFDDFGFRLPSPVSCLLTSVSCLLSPCGFHSIVLSCKGLDRALKNYEVNEDVGNRAGLCRCGAGRELHELSRGRGG